eukprot:Blabericola_migrator_1__4976@NODE_2589_length_2568_cov_11_915634_g1621_i0_p2_GENE_NODE_2589_length_2568_cov_11_915634_g1621_i0NODE_2589_length_2568_cov_11_915634_g1621_i0_p2_ORF_typecomplete_len226_score23_67eIF6/PF01912_18/1_1e67_NODE_2589_length_2568_cov_11_915634_g1621_i0312989
MQRANFNNSSDIGAYVTLTNSYVIIGASQTSHIREMLERSLNLPIVDITINGSSNIGSLIQGNRNGVLVPSTTQEREVQHLRESLPASVRVHRLDAPLKALGNVILCNDNVALVHPEVSQEIQDTISHVLSVAVYKMSIGDQPYVGAYGVMNNQALLVTPEARKEDQMALSELLTVRVMAGTVNAGEEMIGSGVVVNDCIGFCGESTTDNEMRVMESLFGIKADL